MKSFNSLVTKELQLNRLPISLAKVPIIRPSVVEAMGNRQSHVGLVESEMSLWRQSGKVTTSLHMRKPEIPLIGI